MIDAYISQNEKITVIACSRRIGKSYTLCILASETCLQNPNSIVKYVCPQKSQVKVNIQPIMMDIFKDCPAELKPEFKHNEYMYVFPNGSQIHLAGTDNGHHEKLRGSASHLWIVDEAGFCDELDYVVRTILGPTTDTTGGRGIIASTPSKSSDHEFITEFFNPAKFKGTLIKYTLYDNPLLTPETIREIISRFKLKEKDPEFRREYLCEVQNNSDLAIIPEFTDEVQKDCIKEVERPPFYDAYVSMDIGFKDLTVVLFAYYDFRNARVIVEDEIVINGKALLLDKFANDIRKKEEGLWTNSYSGEFKSPYMRVADNNNLILLNELTYKHNILFMPTRKDNKEAALNTVRMLVADHKLIIHPRCKTLIHHMQNGCWTKNHKDFARSPDTGHYDAIDSLIYLIRNIQEKKNPYPAGYGFLGSENHYSPFKEKVATKSEQAWINLFKSRKSIK